jgi:outer membrane protein OmpA-like peptidoglycan-associated protein
MIRYFTTVAIAVAACAALIASEVKAEKVLVYREGQLVNPHEVAAVLGKTRSIRLLDDAPAASAGPTPTAAIPLTKPSANSGLASGARDTSYADASALSLPVRFGFASSDILPAARAQLDALAEGIKLLAPDRMVTIEGHTDAAGPDAYNLLLSRARAQAVRNYLVQQRGIDAARLRAVGYGEERPIEGSDPHDAGNRRVQFRGA